MMLNGWAQHLTDILLRHKVIENSRRPIFVYGFELLLSTSLSILSIIIISVFLSQFSAALTFLVVFISLRLFNGGLHAKTYGRCFLLSNAVYFVVLYSSIYAAVLVPVDLFRLGYLAITFLSAGTIIFLSPVKHINHPLSEESYKRNQTIGRCLALTYACLNCINLYISHSPLDSVLVTFTLMAVAIMMIIPKFAERRKGK